MRILDSFFLAIWYVHFKNLYDGFKNIWWRFLVLICLNRDCIVRSSQAKTNNSYFYDGRTQMASDKVSYNNGKDWRYIIDYDVDMETVIPLFIKTPKTTFDYRISRGKNALGRTFMVKIFYATCIAMQQL